MLQDFIIFLLYFSLLFIFLYKVVRIFGMLLKILITDKILEQWMF